MYTTLQENCDGDIVGQTWRQGDAKFPSKFYCFLFLFTNPSQSVAICINFAQNDNSSTILRKTIQRAESISCCFLNYHTNRKHGDRNLVIKMEIADDKKAYLPYRQ